MTVGAADPTLRGRSAHKWAGIESLFLLWVGLALVSLGVVPLLLRAMFPIFTGLWLGIPLVAVLRHCNAAAVGFRRVPWRPFLEATALNLGGVLLLTGGCEVWSHTYGALIAQAVAAENVDSTFAWLVRYEGWGAWAGLLLYSGLVTIFAEELFFRGWLLHLLLLRLRPVWAIAGQAALFAVPQAIAALLLAPLQGVLYVVVYCFLAIGVVGGWAAWRTQSIWPSLVVATAFNLVFTFLVLPA